MTFASRILPHEVDDTHDSPRVDCTRRAVFCSPFLTIFLFTEKYVSMYKLLSTYSAARQKVIQFMLNTWNETAARFQRTVWNHFPDMEEKPRRINNTLESWRGRLWQKAAKARPNLFEFVYPLKEEHVYTE